MTQFSNKVQAGKLRHRIRIVDEASTSSQDTFGGVTTSTPLIVADNVPASVEFQSETQKYTADEFVSLVTYHVTIRWQPGIRSNQLVLWNDAEGNLRNFQIQNPVNPDGRSKMLILVCLERNSSALVPF